MDYEKMKVYTAKARYVDRLAELLREGDLDIVSLDYNVSNDGWLEIVRIHASNGYVTSINVTGNSKVAILKEVVDEIYGDGAYGKIDTKYMDSKEEE